MNPFFDLLDATDDVIDAIGGEAFVLTPQAGPANTRAGRDEARPVVRGEGVFAEEAERAAPGVTVPARSLAIGRTPFFTVDRRLFGSLPRRGDVLTLPGRGRSFTVVQVSEDASSRIRLTLAETGPRG